MSLTENNMLIGSCHAHSPNISVCVRVCMYFESNCWLILQLNLTLGQCLSLCQLRWREHAETAASKCGALIPLRQKVDEVKN